jgi:hypothetical protein
LDDRLQRQKQEEEEFTRLPEDTTNGVGVNHFDNMYKKEPGDDKKSKKKSKNKGKNTDDVEEIELGNIVGGDIEPATGGKVKMDKDKKKKKKKDKKKGGDDNVEEMAMDNETEGNYQDTEQSSMSKMSALKAMKVMSKKNKKGSETMNTEEEEAPEPFNADEKRTGSSSSDKKKGATPNNDDDMGSKNGNKDLF